MALTAAMADRKSASLEYTFLPPHDSETNDVTKIYDVENLVPAEVWANIDVSGTMKALTKADKTDESVNEMRLGKYCNRVVNGLASERDKAVRSRLLKYIHLLSSMILFATLPRTRKCEVLMKMEYVPHPVRMYLLNNFTEQSARGKEDEVTSALETKLLCYICIIALTVRKFALESQDIDLLSADLQLDSNKVRRYFTQVGCPPSSTKMSLRAPLKLPELRTKGAKRK